MPNPAATFASIAFLFLTIGVWVGVWLRGYIDRASSADADVTPTEPDQSTPPSTPFVFPSRSPKDTADA